MAEMQAYAKYIIQELAWDVDEYGTYSMRLKQFHNAIE
jgi:hypothetical protein